MAVWHRWILHRGVRVGGRALTALPMALLITGLALAQTSPETPVEARSPMATMAGEWVEAPDFTLPKLGQTDASEAVRLSDYRGQYVLLDFWASWCGPCRQSFPVFDAMRERLQARLGPDRFEILAVNVDVTAAEALTFLEQYPVRFPILREETGATQQAYQLIAMPSSFLIDPQGRLLMAHHGFSPGFAAGLEDWILTQSGIVVGSEPAGGGALTP